MRPSEKQLPVYFVGKANIRIVGHIRFYPVGTVHSLCVAPGAGGSCPGGYALVQRKMCPTVAAPGFPSAVLLFSEENVIVLENLLRAVFPEVIRVGGKHCHVPFHQLIQIMLCNFTLVACLFTDKRIYLTDAGSPAAGAEETVADCVCSFNRRHISAIESTRKWVAAAPGHFLYLYYN